MKIGIFGGSFNPPHKMHFDIGANLIKSGYVDKVIYVPTGSKYKYKNNLVSDEHRYRMLELMIKDDDRFSVSGFEFKNYVVYTCETLKYFQDLYSDDEIYFVCGADNLSYIDTWKNAVYLLENYKFLVIRRLTDNIDDILKRLDKYKDNIIITDISLSSLSSTEIRNKIKNKEDVSDDLNSEVLDYLLKNRLYD